MTSLDLDTEEGQEQSASLVGDLANVLRTVAEAHLAAAGIVEDAEVFQVFTMAHAVSIASLSKDMGGPDTEELVKTVSDMVADVSDDEDAWDFIPDPSMTQEDLDLLALDAPSGLKH